MDAKRKEDINKAADIYTDRPELRKLAYEAKPTQGWAPAPKPLKIRK